MSYRRSERELVMGKYVAAAPDLSDEEKHPLRLTKDGKLLTSDPTIEGKVDDIEGKLDDGTHGLAALKTLIDAVEDKLDDGTHGLSALQVLITAIKAETDQLPNWRFEDKLSGNPVVDNVASATEANLTSISVTPTFPTGATRQRALVVATLHAAAQAAGGHKVGLTLQRNINSEGWVDVVDLTATAPLSIPDLDEAMATFCIVCDVTTAVDTSGETVEFRWQVDSDNAASVNYTSDFVLLIIYSM